jgi:hypothetical protein
MRDRSRSRVGPAASAREGEHARRLYFRERDISQIRIRSEYLESAVMISARIANLFSFAPRSRLIATRTTRGPPRKLRIDANDASSRDHTLRARALTSTLNAFPRTVLFIRIYVARITFQLILKCTTLSRLVERGGISARKERCDYRRATINYTPPGDSGRCTRDI